MRALLPLSICVLLACTSSSSEATTDVAATTDAGTEVALSAE